MTLQNVRAFLWRGDDLGFGTGNAREMTVSSQVVGSAKPLIFTRAFAGSVDISAMLTTTSPWPTNGKQRILVNRNARYWLTVSGTMYPATTGTGISVSFPVAPLQMVFLPINFGGTVTVAANSTWPIPQPLTGSPGATVPVAQATTQLTFDLVVEQ